jgi:hypothetical protein
MDYISNVEKLNIDQKGFFMIDLSQQPPEPLVTGMPLFLDSASGI